VLDCYGRRRRGHECQHEAPARWPATLHRGGVPRVMTWPGPHVPGQARASQGGGVPTRRSAMSSTAPGGVAAPAVVRLVGRRHVDLLRVSSALCRRA